MYYAEAEMIREEEKKKIIKTEGEEKPQNGKKRRGRGREGKNFAKVKHVSTAKTKMLRNVKATINLNDSEDKA